MSKRVLASSWQQIPHGDSADLATVVASRSGTRIAVRTALATLICALIDWTEREDGGDYLLKPGDCGGCDRHPIAVS